MTYCIPRKGDRVQVVAVHALDTRSKVRAGDFATCTEDSYTTLNLNAPFVVLFTEGGVVWAHVRPAPLLTEPAALVEPAPPPVFMSADSATRKLMPLASGCLGYFPDALLCVSFVSRVGNDKHNPGQPLHWDKTKSDDQPDAEARHMLDHLRGDPPDPGLEPLGDLGHLASKAWRALAHLQRACDAERARFETSKAGKP